MLEAVGIPILMKAVEFFFEEGRAILRERRERRASDQQEAGTPTSTAPATTSGNVMSASTPANPKVIVRKDEFLRERIAKVTWTEHRREVEHLLSLAEIHSRNYRLAKEQYAKWGSALVPPIILNNLEEAEDAVADTMTKLRAALSAVASENISLPHPE